MVIPKPNRRIRGSFFLRSRIFNPAWPRKTTWVKIILAIVCLFVLFVLVNNVVMPIVTRHGREFSLPTIVGMTVEQAKPVLEETDLALIVTSQEYHPDKPTGTILSQFPVGGTMVKSGRTIKVVTSLGQKAVAVPDVRGFSIRQARLDLEAAGFALGDIQWTYTDSLPEKVVVFTFPKVGTMIPYGSPVNLLVNRSADQMVVTVPRVIGLSLEEATRLLEEKGLKVGNVTRVVDENYLPETVMEQSEAEGIELLQGEAVDLSVSSTE
jgi:eukaryotic-like serine/threonine-protein kinase